MILKFQYPVGAPNTLWTDETAQSLIGQSFTAKVEERDVGEGKVLDAVVGKDSRFLDLIVEWPDDTFGDETVELEDMSFEPIPVKDI